MVVAFAVTAVLTWLSTLGHLILIPPVKQRRINIIDEFCDRDIGRRVRNWVPLHALYADCFYQVTMALSDQQLVTGIAILVAGLKMYAQDSISVYLFSVVRELAFFSSNSHLLSLLALWNTFSSERKRFKPTGSKRHFPVLLVIKWRFFCMFVFFVLLLVTTWKTVYQQWDDMYACPARCVPRGTSQLGGPPLGWAIATTYFLTTTYFLYTIQLGEKILGRQARIRAWATRPSDTLQKRLEFSPKTLGFTRFVGHAVLAWRFWVFSVATELVVVMAWGYANFVWTLPDRADGRRLMKEYSNQEWTKENQMGFGQIVPLLLLMLPFMTFAAAYNGRSSYIVSRNSQMTFIDNMEILPAENQQSNLNVPDIEPCAQ